MHINFKSVELHNFMSFGHSKLDISDDGFIKVTGINENVDDMATSNGSGKSSLWEAIIWVLTGETIRGTKQISNLYGDDGTYVRILFDIDANQYEIIRSKDHKQYKTSLQIQVNGKDCSGKGIRESEKLLEQYLPDITSSLLGSVIILGQGLPQKFTSNTPSGRKEVLEKLSKSDFMIEDLKERVSTRKSFLNTKIKELQESIIALESKKSYIASQISQSELAISELDKTEIEERAKKATEEYNALLSKQQSINSLIELLTNDIDNLNHLISTETDTYNEKLKKLTDEYDFQLNQYRQTVIKMKLSLDRLNKEIQRIRQIKDICPTCGQKLIGVEKPSTDDLERQATEQNSELVRVEGLLNEMSNEMTTISSRYKSEYIDAKKDYETELKDKKNLLTKQQMELRECVNSINSSSAVMMEAQAKLVQLTSSLETHNRVIEEGRREISGIETSVNSLSTEKTAQQLHLDVVNKFDTALKRDFRGYLLSTLIDYISKRTKEYCKVIFDTDKIDFCLDGNNIDINYLGKTYENLSGGEKQKIDLIVQFSIRDMLCSHLGFTSNILVLDEVFDSLDVLGCQKVVDLITTLSDIKNVYIVTHRKDLSIPYDKELTVIKSQDGISDIR